MLTEKEKMQRAKVYMLKLADGINPIDDSELDVNALNSERLAKCFTYVADVLDTAISENKTSVRTKRGKKAEFYISNEQLASIELLPGDVVISELVSSINRAADNDNMKKLQPKLINDWLTENGYLRNSEYGGKKRRELTKKSAEIGISSKKGIGSFGEYKIILYSETAQKFITDNLLNIIEYSKKQNSDKE